MRKFLSIIIVLSMLLNCIPALAVADADKPIISILTDSSENKVKITSDSVVSDTKLYVVAFNEEAMIGAVSKPVDLKIGENIIDMEPTWSVGERDVVKIFLWDENMEPLADMVIAKTPMITVETLYADATDGTVKVEVSVLNNPGVSSLKFDVAYDDYLTLTGVELSEDFGAYLTAAEPFTNPQPISMISPLEDIYTSGVIATLTFDMSNVPENMEYADISIICDDENIFDSEFNYVDFSAVNGKIIFDETLTLAECADEDIELMSAENLTLTVDEVSGMPGETVEVNLTLSNNPGIASLMFNVEYSELLTLEAVKFNSDFGAYATAAQPFTSPQPISFISPFSDVTIDDTFATLTFRISDTAEDKSVANINITYSEDDVFNSLYEYVDLTVVNGKVTVYEGIPGDINADGKVNNMDAILLFRYVAKWNVEVDEEALDVTGDSKIGNIDAIQLFRYVAKWPGIILVRGSVCVHELEEVPEKEATCTEDGNIAYWHCSKCDKYYSDAKASKMIALSETITEATGHTEVVLPAVAPTYTETGLTEGRKCSVCEKILMPQEKVPALDLEEYYISYSFTDGDPYLQSLVAKGVLVNENPTTYTKQDTIKLKNLSVDGYIFEGWFDGPWEDASRITTISNQSGSLTLYAKWSKITYTVTFDSPDVPVESVSYTVDTEVTLTNPSWFGYTFVGWSKDGKIVSSIPKGTTGNITLHANWTSNRNRATAVNSLDSPIVIEDWNNGRYLFVYEIGTIENVPLGVIEYIGNSQGITINKEYTYTQTVSESFADTIAQTVSNATTKTSSWTLSEEWNKSASATNEHEEVEGKTASQTDSEGNVTEGKYYVSNSEGGVTSTTSSAGGSSGTSSKVTEGSSTGINGSYTRGAEKAGSVSVDISHTKSHTDTSNSNWNASGTVGYTPPEKTGGIGGSGTIGGGHEWGDEDTTEDSTSVGVEVSAKDSESATIAGERAENFGTENTSSSESHWDISNTSTSSWNSTAGYEVGQSTSMNTEISNTISEAIYDRYSYTSVASRGGGTASTQSTGESQSLSNEYASTVEYLSEDQATISKSIVYNSDATGYYRLVTAGTLHVFAVVGYDIATNSYYTYTYNVLDEERHEYLDYSKDNANFNDCENAIIPFEVPYYVNEFITSVIARSEGLVVDMETGFITEYNGEATDVVIPQYISVDNGDGTYSAVRIRGFEEDAFKGNTKITGVVLPKYVSEIPDNAFAGCTSLKTVIAYGVSEIGDNAFAGCTSLDKFSVDEHISSLGEKAFKDVPEISVVAENENIFNATINSGAKRITLNLTAMDTTLTDKTILINESTDYFALVGNGSEYSNVQLESHATETFISNMNFVNNTGTALKFSSAMVTLSRVTVENATEFALVLMAENTALNLYGTIVLSSSGDNAVISKNVTLAKANSEVAGKLDFSGKYLVCGDVTNISMLKYPENVKEITAEEYAKYMTTVTVSFDTDGGTDIISVTTGYDTKITAPQNPEKDHYSFLGWYTDEACTTEFSFNTSITNDMTLYAKWKLNEFKISFDANGGTADVSEKSVIYGTTVGTLPTPTRSHYIFDGWYTEKTEGTKYTDTTVFAETMDITLYARWIIKPYTVKWSAGTGTTITVKRTSSPNANASIGTLSSGAAVYYGDVLSVAYAVNTGYTLSTKGSTSITVTDNVTASNIYATATVNSYTAKWSIGTGYTITVKRTSSSNKGASTGALSSGATVYYGDVLSVTYAATTGYTLSTKGSTSITVTGNVTSSNIYATATANSYTYNIKYVSSNGTNLGTATVTKKYNTTNTITPKDFTGYTTPSTQSIKWDSTSAKTITFKYTPKSVGTKTLKDNAWWWKNTSSTGIKYTVKVSFYDRTATSVKAKITWTNTISAGLYYGFWSKYNVTIGGTSTGDVTITDNSVWSKYKNYSSQRTITKESTITIKGLSATQTSVSYTATPSAHSNASCPAAFSGTLTIPAY